ncbi:MAG: flagellar hook-associated protein FlgL [Clostridium cochlearium]|uniref:flagellar hook-associated protein FlgL n=1 Tax=Clostridium cochlearium TaxID=1494 RepID=UPI00280BDAB5|nr:flagellar hook-associated protein FlgL [Clostridium cochlearium]MDU1443902.1 flagellar hook-associated protein FlgL [Clostridium cochlearium]
MRVTNRMLANNFLTDMTTNLNNLQTLQQQLTSGKEIRRPSDDPLKVARAMQLHSEIGINKQYNENIKDTLSWLEQTDTALGQLGDQSQRIRELLVSAGDIAYGTDERKKINDEIKEIIGQMSQTLNASFDGRFIFGGTRGTAKPVNIIKGPMVTKVQKSSDTAPEGKVTGSFTGNKNENYTIEIIEEGTSLKAVVKENGIEKSKDDMPTSGKKTLDLGNGIKFEIDSAAKKGDKYEFTALADGQKLVYADRFGNEIVDSNVVEVTDLNKWKGKDIVFNYVDSTDNKVKEETIKIDGTISDIDNLVSDINRKITGTGLDGKLTAERVESNGKDYIKFEKLDDKSNIQLNEDKTKVSDMESFNHIDIMGEKLVTEISQGVRVEYNITAVDVIKFNDNKGNDRDLRIILEDIVKHLESDDPKDIKKITNEDLAALDAVMDNILKLRSQVGAKGNRMESALEKNKEENFNLTEILSKTEDIDLVEKTMEYAVAISVYMASLQTSARVLQPTLMDYVR